MDMYVTLRFIFLCIVSYTQWTAASVEPTETPPEDEVSYFKWVTTEWSKCEFSKALQISCCECFRMRQVSCVYTQPEGMPPEQMPMRNNTAQIYHPEGPIVPPFYCAKYADERPLDIEPCSPCERDCVMSTWEEWSSCTLDCSPSERHRTRRLLLPSITGSDCGPLVEFDMCAHLPLCPITDLLPSFRWRKTPWTSCRKLGEDCGRGLKHRQVDCVNGTGGIVADVFCEHYLIDSVRPSDIEACSPACDCEVDSWERWSTCSVTCHRGPNMSGRQMRTRGVRVENSHGGRACPPLIETQPCPSDRLPPCPRYVWRTGAWGRCELPEGTNGTQCGPGLQRRPVNCIQEFDDEETHVHHVLCTQGGVGTCKAYQRQCHKNALLWGNASRMIRPERKRACHVTCPRDCQLGEWENWSSCTKSCGTDGVRIRTKPVLVEPTRGGKSCGTRYDTSACDPVPCIWWHTGRWSKCFMDSPSATCGNGQSVRSTYCLSSLDEVLPDANCTDLGDKPESQKKCRLPCEDECQISEWTDWGPCSVSCGPQGGTQIRIRRIITDSPDGPCMPADALEQSRVCNQVPCRDYLWQYSAWSSCAPIASGNSSSCTNNSGVRTRDVFCQKDSGYPLMENDPCDQSIQPVSWDTCDAPCPQACHLGQWLAWSECSHPCGAESVRTRVRRVLAWPMHGGEPCPPDTRSDGTIRQTRPCKGVPSCQNHAWEVGDWGPCESETGCGWGLHTRAITCIKMQRNKNVTEDDSTCQEQIFGLPPETQKPCFQGCAGDCGLSDWTEFGACPSGCSNGPGHTQRTRGLLYPDPRLDIVEQCPSLKTSDFTETRPCPDQTCHTYNWAVGPWTTCVVQVDPSDESNIACGNGLQRRHVMCQRDDGMAVEDYRCEDVVSMPRRHRACSVECPPSCDVTEWGEWEPCSYACGTGIKTRSRQLKNSALDNDGNCDDLLVGSITCTERPCTDFEWRTTEWSECAPFYNLPCGSGSQTRQVFCPSGVEFEHECERRLPKPLEEVACDRPCLGDCVLSEWSDWSDCVCEDVFTPEQRRTREIVTEPLPSGKACGPLAESRECSCSGYRLSLSPWTSCLLEDTTEECGAGIQSRSVACLRDDIPFDLSFCGELTEPLTQSCELPCPEHCKLSPMEPWTPCSAACGPHSFKTRGQSILELGNAQGQQCPIPDLLLQNTTCHSEPCFTYTWSRGTWTSCLLAGFPEVGCGLGVRRRTVNCERNDGELADESRCIESEGSSFSSLLSLSNDVLRDFDLHMEEQCGSPCPGDCLLSEWSPFGPCFLDCSDLQLNAIQVRSRVVLKPAEDTREPCPINLQDIRRCDRADALCPIFTWQTLDWGGSDFRKVQCVAHDGHKVHGGCLASEMPSATLGCRPPCGAFARCEDGLCKCNRGYEGDGYTCLPLLGCQVVEHCIFNYTVCDIPTKTCICANGMALGKGFMCPLPRVSANLNLHSPLFNFLLYILLGSALSLVVVTLCIVAFVFRKKKRRKHSHSTSTKVESSSTSTSKTETMSKEYNSQVKENVNLIISPQVANLNVIMPPRNESFHQSNIMSASGPKVPPKESILFGSTKQSDRKVNFVDFDQHQITTLPIGQKSQGVNTNEVISIYDHPCRADPPPLKPICGIQVEPYYEKPVSHDPKKVATIVQAYPRGNYAPYHPHYDLSDIESGLSEDSDYDHPPPIAPRPPHTKMPSPLMRVQDRQEPTPSPSSESQRSSSPSSTKRKKQTRFADTPTAIPEVPEENEKQPSSPDKKTEVTLALPTIKRPTSPKEKKDSSSSEDKRCKSPGDKPLPPLPIPEHDRRPTSPPYKDQRPTSPADRDLPTTPESDDSYDDDISSITPYDDKSSTTTFDDRNITTPYDTSTSTLVDDYKRPSSPVKKAADKRHKPQRPQRPHPPRRQQQKKLPGKPKASLYDDPALYDNRLLPFKFDKGQQTQEDSKQRPAGQAITESTQTGGGMVPREQAVNQNGPGGFTGAGQMARGGAHGLGPQQTGRGGIQSQHAPHSMGPQAQFAHGQGTGGNDTGMPVYPPRTPQMGNAVAWQGQGYQPQNQGYQAQFPGTQSQFQGQFLPQGQNQQLQGQNQQLQGQNQQLQGQYPSQVMAAQSQPQAPLQGQQNQLVAAGARQSPPLEPGQILEHTRITDIHRIITPPLQPRFPDHMPAGYNSQVATQNAGHQGPPGQMALGYNTQASAQNANTQGTGQMASGYNPQQNARLAGQGQSAAGYTQATGSGRPQGQPARPVRMPPQPYVPPPPPVEDYDSSESDSDIDDDTVVRKGTAKSEEVPLYDNCARDWSKNKYKPLSNHYAADVSSPNDRKQPPPVAPKPKPKKNKLLTAQKPNPKTQTLSSAESEELDNLIGELQQMGK